MYFWASVMPQYALVCSKNGLCRVYSNFLVELFASLLVAPVIDA